ALFLLWNERSALSVRINCLGYLKIKKLLQPAMREKFGVALRQLYAAKAPASRTYREQSN
ncbi:MAG TPA: hypothetical protein VEK35_10590, partial [Roseiarcus sp.]|nr:hypothetical protein [Roseiarcus sp.]